MTPYFAIIKDSFREAMYSRVLWIMLVMISMLLLVIAPVSYTEQLSTGVYFEDLERERWIELALRIAEESERKEASPSRVIWQSLSKSTRNSLEELASANQKPLEEFTEDDIQKLQTTVNALPASLSIELDEALTNAEFYDEQAWSEAELNEEAKELLDLGFEEMREEEVQRLNRLLLEAAYPDLINESPPRSIVFTYLGYELLGAIRIRKQQFSEAVESLLLSGVIWFCSFCMFVAVLVTAQIIPLTFEVGSLNLLLSKPISRWKLFITQYLGGCAFILLAMSYLFVGFWLILGLRIGYWNHGILYYIPGFMFMFAIYYAVSAVIGLIWRSTIVAAIVCILFYCACFGFDVSKFFLEGLMHPYEIARIEPAGDSLISVNEAGQVRRWKSRRQEWEVIYRTEEEERNPFLLTSTSVGPVYDAKADQLISIEEQFGFGFGGAQTISVGKPSKKWKREMGAAIPPATIALLTEPDGQILAVSHLGFFRSTGDLSIPPKTMDEESDLLDKLKSDETVKHSNDDSQAPESSSTDSNQDSATDAPAKNESDEQELSTDESNESDSKNTDSSDDESGNVGQSDDDERYGDHDSEIQGTTEGERGMASFQYVGPDDKIPNSRPLAFALDAKTGTVVIYSRGTIKTYQPSEKVYLSKSEAKFEENQGAKVSLAFGDNVLLVARDDGMITRFDVSKSGELSKKEELELEGAEQPRYIAVSPSGQWFAVTYQNGNLWVMDANEGNFTRAKTSGQGRFSAIQFTPDNTLLAVVDGRNVNEYSLDPLMLKKQYKATLSRIAAIYHCVVVPAYTVFPKPRLINDTVKYLITGEKTTAPILRPSKLGDARRQLRPWSLVWSGLLFVVVVLGIGCLYFERQEF